MKRVHGLGMRITNLLTGERSEVAVGTVSIDEDGQAQPEWDHEAMQSLLTTPIERTVTIHEGPLASDIMAIILGISLYEASLLADTHITRGEN